jgi:hypothetical protein
VTPQKQTVFGDGRGNCWAACVAALLDIPLSEVPNFCGEPERNERWYLDTDRWLQRYGYRIIGFSFPDASLIEMAVEPGTYLIVTGKSPRGEFLHSVVAEYLGGQQWEIVCDPHPSDDGLDGPWKACDMIVASSRPRS